MLHLKNISLQAGQFHLKDISLDVSPADYFVLMGPTGSGKSLLIKSICGLISAEQGRIIIDGTDITKIEPKNRQIGYVPQDSALFPHLNVQRNLAFALEIAGAAHSEINHEIEKIVDTLNISHLLERSTVNLSGGERQKVALGRALLRKPKLLVLDEPVSALDEPARAEICRILRQVQQSFSLTTFHVCHSIAEARLVSDNMGIMSNGELIQVDTLDNIIKKPANQQVEKLLNL